MQQVSNEVANIHYRKNSINTRITFAKFKTHLTNHGGTCI